MWGLIVGVALGGLLLMTAVTCLREGELAVGEVVLRRGEPRFWAAVGLLGVAGLAAAGSAVALAADLEEAPDRTVEHAGFSFVIPSGWAALEDSGAPLVTTSTPDLGVAGYRGPTGEAMVMWRRAPLHDAVRHDAAAGSGDPRQELLASLREPGLDYRRWDPSDQGAARAVDMAYPSPRGSVRARALARIDDGPPARVAWIMVSCTYDGRPDDCEHVASSLRLSGR